MYELMHEDEATMPLILVTHNELTMQEEGVSRLVG